MIKADVSLIKGLAAARTLFGQAFQPCEALKAMTYFQGGDIDTLPGRTIHTLVDAAAKVGGDLPAVKILCRSLAIDA
jgi:hypothetical protein